MKNKKERTDNFFKYLFASFAILSILILVLIAGYIIWEGIQPFLPTNEYGGTSFIDFITGMNWNPNLDQYGILYMILGTLASVVLSIILAVPIALLTAIAISEVLPPKVAYVVSTAIELLAGIPSIIYGIVGLAVIVPIIYGMHPNQNPYPFGNSLLATSLVLAIMILPTIVTIAQTSLKAVPEYYREASYGLGATKMQTIFKVVVPAAKSGIIAGVILGIGRALGETMAVVMVAGNVGGGFTGIGKLNEFIFQPIRPLTASIAVDIGYADGLHKQLLFSTALILFIFIFLLNITVQWISKRGDRIEKNRK